MSRLPIPATIEASPAAAQPLLTNYVNEVAKTEIDFPVVTHRAR
jgi:hypothetical protein